MKNNYQRKNSKSNTDVGKSFELLALRYFDKLGIKLLQNYSLDIGIENKRKHKFDLGNDKYLIECKSIKWTETGKVPSAKIKPLNETMYYFHLAPKSYSKILFVEMDYCQKRLRTLLEYYIEKYFHLIPTDVVLYDFYGEHCEIFTSERIKNYIQ